MGRWYSQMLLTSEEFKKILKFLLFLIWLNSLLHFRISEVAGCYLVLMTERKLLV